MDKRQYILLHAVKDGVKVRFNKRQFSALYRHGPILPPEGTLIITKTWQYYWEDARISQLIHNGRFHMIFSEILAGPDRDQLILDRALNEIADKQDKHVHFCFLVLPVNKYLKEDLQCILNHSTPSNAKQITKINQGVAATLQRAKAKEMNHMCTYFNKLHQKIENE